ncbi:multidrug effflux MFS transporter [Bradyrhizobium lablabi]|uniref:multidrug effflux MFS transporter n=1 Tax=Bradyrhizobium lablabi TaxID=722472 RepID=UPI001BA9D003|nr:multidrug effflux MFS transporter [Bradyrhizobium lablabi]MBR0697120.1 multidrug effflux MFS transporter [Bradyrhizobium lablabi]
MHGVMGRPPGAATNNIATSKIMLLMLVVMTGVAPISLYMLVPALPVLATTFGRDISIAQMTVSLYMVGIACSQLVMGPLSDKFGRRPVLLAGLGLMVLAGVGSVFAQTLPQLIAARFVQALGGASGMVISRAIIRDLYPRERVGAMISLVVAALMIAQMVSPLTGGLLETAFGWRAILYLITGASLAITIFIALALPETRRDRAKSGGFRGDIGKLITDRAFVGYMLCQVLASQIIFAFAGGGPYIVVTQMGRSSAEYGAWFATTGFAYLVGNLLCVRFAPRHSLEGLIWFGLALQLGASLSNLIWSFAGLNQAPLWLFGTQMIVMVANAFVMANSAAGAISIRPEAAGTASGAMGFLQQGIGSLVSQSGAYLGGHSTTTLPLTAAIFAISIACACTMIFIVPRRNVVVSEKLIEQAEEDRPGGHCERSEAIHTAAS